MMSRVKARKRSLFNRSLRRRRKRGKKNRVFVKNIKRSLSWFVFVAKKKFVISVDSLEFIKSIRCCLKENLQRQQMNILQIWSLQRKK